MFVFAGRHVLPRLRQAARRAVHTTVREIDNRDTVLKDLDRALNRHKPPSIEYVYVETDFQQIFKNKTLGSGSHSALNPYGHSSLRYSFDDKDYIANVSGALGKQLLNLFQSSDYLFGDDSRTNQMGSDQGGIYRRAFRGFRIENVPVETVQKLHQYFLDMQTRSKTGEASYSMVWGNTWPLINRLNAPNETGNCSYWTSRALQHIGVIDRPTMFPKMLFIKLYFQLVLAAAKGDDSLFNPSNINIVAYRKQAATGHDAAANSWIAPHWAFSAQGAMFRALERFANAVVVTPSRPLDDRDQWQSHVILEPTPYRPLVKLDDR